MGTRRTTEEKDYFLQQKIREARKTGRMLETKMLRAEFCLRLSSTPRAFQERLKILEDFGTIRIHKDRIEVLK